MGKAMAMEFAATASHIILCARNLESLEGTKNEILQKFPAITIDVFSADLSIKAEVNRFADFCLHKFTPDILINNAGVQHVAPIEEFPIGQADMMLSLMLRTPFFLTQKVLPHMYSKKWGRIIGISSIHGHVASPNKSVYITAKHGLEGLTKVTALEGGPHGVTANTIAASYARTALVEKQIKSLSEINKLSESEVVQEVMLQPAAIKRLIEPEEIAQLALYLCGPYSASITGSSFGIDNGWTAR